MGLFAQLLVFVTSSTVGVQYEHRLLYVPVAIDHHAPVPFLLDTGANVSAIDESLVEKFGLQSTGDTQIEGTAGVSKARKTKVGSFSLGSSSVKDLRPTVQNLTGLLDPPGGQTLGILGNDFLKHFVVEINYRAKTMTLRDSGVEEGLSIPFQMDNGIPRLNGTLNGSISADLRIDTGASLFETEDVYLNIPTRVWKRLAEIDPDLKPSTYFKGSGVGGSVDLAVAQIKSLTLGSLEIRSPFVIVQPEQGYFARPDAAGFVSNNLLEKFSPVTIDYAGRRLYLTRR
jgi:hypothetical protein